ncbi:MAG: nuclear transport factor 2 family protein [Anaerolineales bacterium]|jgi:limonene-1,2-epoxide hydrolase|nr:nuclear transport factor 2 family protein [Anaerolineales bacterium]
MNETNQPQNENQPPILEPLNTERIRDLWSRTYNREGKPDWSHLFPYYHEQIVFEDTIQRVEGITEFKAMCNRLADRCEQLTMEILSMVMDGKDVFFQWKMVMAFKKYPNTPLYGCTKLTLGDDNRIIMQRDYFDIWGTILNGIPILRKPYWKFMRRYFG